MSRTDVGLSIRAVANLDGVNTDWDRLVDQMRQPTPFMRSWWVAALAGNRLRMPLVYDGDELVGGLPLVSTAITPRLKRIKSLDVTDYTDIVATRGRENEVAAALRQWLVDQRAIIDITCASDSLCATLIPRPCWVARTSALTHEISGSFDCYLASRSSQWRQTVRRCRSHAARSGITVRAAEDEELPLAFDLLVRLHEHQWAGSSHFLRGADRVAQALRSAGAKKEAVILQAVRNDDVIGSQLWFEVGGCSYFYQGGRDKDTELSTGTLLFAAAIERACTIGQSRIDLLNGEDRYKSHWATNKKGVLTLKSGTVFAGRVLLDMAASRQPRYVKIARE